MNMRPQPPLCLRERGPHVATSSGQGFPGAGAPLPCLALRATPSSGAGWRALLEGGTLSMVAGGALMLAACSSAAAPTTSPAVPGAASGLRAEGETHFSELVQLTDGGENAEAYWSSSGTELIFQAHAGEGCDQIYTMGVDRPLPQPKQVSTGKGATTCAYFMPGDEQIIYSSTHLGGDACPPKPDHSKGYVWPLYPSYDIFKANADGSQVQPLTSQPGYDAEATVCRKDGSIIFTSSRDGDL